MLQTDPSVLAQPIVFRGLRSAGGAYSFSWRKRVAAEIADFRPDIAHVHNIWPHMTPSVYLACRDAAVPVVQTLHNYRLACNGDFLTRNGSPCSLCVGKKFGWPGVLHRCTMNSFAISMVKAGCTSIHTRLNTWNRSIDTFLAPSESIRAVAIRAGIEAQRVRVKPSFALDPGFREGPRRYFCFAGRLSHQKGISQMIEAWRELPDVALRISVPVRWSSRCVISPPPTPKWTIWG